MDKDMHFCWEGGENVLLFAYPTCILGKRRPKLDES